jgi:flagellar hook-basal body complex protein FliE
MHVDAIVPDAPPALPEQTGDDASAFGGMLDAAGARLDAADRAESAFANGSGGLQEMVVARAQADVALQIAAAAAQHAVQSINTLLGMQV